MSKEKKIPPIQPAPVKPFTVRLVDGHFVRVPKLDHTAQTDATRPSAEHGSAKSRTGAGQPPLMRLVNGKFVRVDGQAADRDKAPAVKPRAVRTPHAPSAKAPGEPPITDSWDAAFGTKIDPKDYPSPGVDSLGGNLPANP